MEKKNVGKCDQMARLIAGVVLIGLAHYTLMGTWSIIAYVVGAIMLLVGITRYCPLYTLVGCDSTKCRCKMCGSCKKEGQDAHNPAEGEKTQE